MNEDDSEPSATRRKLLRHSATSSASSDSAPEGTAAGGGRWAVGGGWRMVGAGRADAREKGHTLRARRARGPEAARRARVSGRLTRAQLLTVLATSITAAFLAVALFMGREQENCSAAPAVYLGAIQ